MARASVALLCLAVVAGCASSSKSVRVSYNATADRTKYATKQMRLHDMEVQSGLSTRPRFYLQVQAQCSGQDCTPSTYSLRFLKEGQNPVDLQSLNVELRVGDETMSWDDRQNMEPGQPIRIQGGEVVRVTVSGGQLATLGAVRTVRGSLGGASFSLPHDARAPIRRLTAQLHPSDDAQDGAKDDAEDDAEGNASTGR